MCAKSTGRVNTYYVILRHSSTFYNLSFYAKKLRILEIRNVYCKTSQHKFHFRIVQLNDSLISQPVSLEQIYLRDVNPTEGLGLFIKATFEGHHVVTGTRPGSVAARARRITSGDEVITVNRKAVV